MNNDNFFLAVILSLGILVGFHYFYEKPEMERYQHQLMAQQLETEAKALAPVVVAQPPRDRAEILAETDRVAIDTPNLKGSINLKGARLDDLKLVRYREDVAPESPSITLLSPAGSSAPYRAYYAEFGWLGSGDIQTPNADTVWKATQKNLVVNKPLTLSWVNPQGLTFERDILLDEHYMFTVTDRVKNDSKETVTLYPFGLIARHGKPATQDIYIMHEGPMGVLGGTLKETKYKDLMQNRKTSFESDGGWIGITDKFWLTALVPSQDEKLTGTFTYAPPASSGPEGGAPEDGVFQTDFRGGAVSLAAGATTVHVSRLFAGAKEVRVLDDYEEQFKIPLFDRAIDFGWYYYLTKPFLYLLDYLGGLFGNLGLAIMAFTVLLKILTLPLSMKSFRSMAKMRVLTPQLKAIQDRYKDDKQKIGLETMELYKREKVNPMSGCWPNLIQIPIFFALYKVLYVGIEMRHAPLFGWIHDLSARDPLNVLNGFGALDWSFIPHLGVWPILMGISMYAQQMMNPAPTDKSQAQIFRYMPLIFTFMMSNVAVGLIFYWTWSNILGVVQQWYVYRKTGVSIVPQTADVD